MSKPATSPQEVIFCNVMSELDKWLEEHRKICDMKVKEIPWRQSKEWFLENHKFRHSSGGFFSIVGAIAPRNCGQVEQPLIDQPEIGILGFLIRKSGGEAEILVQAKAEPGNVRLVQAAPSVQATESNYKRRHHGKETQFLEYFINGSRSNRNILSDSLQSEQGTRFLGKYNRNMIVEIRENAYVLEGPAFKWFPIQNLCSLLIQDFQINTDARSVLVCGPWHTLAPNNEPFARWRGKGGLGEALLRSYQASEKESVLSTKEIMDILDRCRRTDNFTTSVVSLTDLEHWEMTEDCLRSKNGGSFEVRQFQIETTEREVMNWDQPLLASDKEGQVRLYAQEKNGVLHFLFSCRAEIGFQEFYQYGPTIQDLGNDLFILPAFNKQEMELKGCLDRSKKILSSLHSDEGGRFYRCISSYSIHLLNKDEVVETGQNRAWMSLKQVEILVKHRGNFSNEARSVISMLLAYL